MDQSCPKCAKRETPFHPVADQIYVLTRLQCRHIPSGFSLYPATPNNRRHTSTIPSPTSCKQIEVAEELHVTPLDSSASSSRLQLWKDSLTDVPSSVKMGLEVAESLPAGSGGDWFCWRAINRLCTGVGRAKTTMRTWGYLDDAQSVDCYCGEPQTMAHLLSCRLLDEACTADDLATVTERAKACARKWENIV